VDDEGAQGGAEPPGNGDGECQRESGGVAGSH
jgi:hypothetical protein